nr:unnamed protein product [Callosobruchus chinensis]
MLYKAQIRPSLQYYSQIWGVAAPTTLSILGAVQRGAIRLIGDPALTCHFQPLPHWRAVGELSLFYRYSNRFRSYELTSISLLDALAEILLLTSRRSFFIHLYCSFIKKNRLDGCQTNTKHHGLSKFEIIYILRRLCTFQCTDLFQTSTTICSSGAYFLYQFSIERWYEDSNNCKNMTIESNGNYGAHRTARCPRYEE